MVPASAFVILSFAGAAAAAPKVLGPNRCLSCHDHDRQKAWFDKDPHSKALEQLEDKKAGKYMAAIGLGDPYDRKGACVSCHATIFNGDANAGVSCETCHGAGSDYLEPHQQKGSHAKSLTLGMFDTRGNLAVWSKMCVDCHIVTDRRLVAAGHSSGAGFDVGVSSRKIVHWAPSYDFAKLSAEGSVAAARRGVAGVNVPAPAPKPTAAGAPIRPAPSPSPAPGSAAPAAKATAMPATPTPAASTPTPTPTRAPAAISAAATVPPLSSTPSSITPAVPSVPGMTPVPVTDEAPPARSGSDVEIRIEATPIPAATAPPPPASTLPPRPTPAPAPTEAPSISPGVPAAENPAPARPSAASAAVPRTVIPVRATPRTPAPKNTLRARPRVTGSPSPAAPSPTVTPTRRPASQEPPRRAPH